MQDGFDILLTQVAQDYGAEPARKLKEAIAANPPASYADLLDLLDTILLDGAKPIEIHHGTTTTGCFEVSLIDSPEEPEPKPAPKPAPKP